MSTNRHPAPLLGIGLLAWCAWLVWPVLSASSPTLLGGEGSDAIRGAWSLDHVARSLPGLVWTERVGWPMGALALPLPFLTGILLAPVNLLLGPVRGYALDVALLLALAGVAVAWLGREVSGSWRVGALAGGAFVAQPMLLHAITDGTPEHLAFWLLPAAAAAGLRATSSRRVAWATVAGALASLTAFDSPYLAVWLVGVAPFAALAMFLAPAAPSEGPRARPLHLLAAATMAAIPGVLLTFLVYRGFTLTPPDTALDLPTALSGNSVDLRSWWFLEHRPDSDVLGTLAPALLPTPWLVASVVLALAAPRRTLPWLALGVTCLVLSLGTRTENVAVLAWWLQAALGPTGQDLGATLGRAVVDLNSTITTLPLASGIRFPRRWLVPAAMGLSLAGTVGAGRLVRLVLDLATSRWGHPPGRSTRLVAWLPGVPVLLGVAGAAGVLACQPWRGTTPGMALPDVAFAAWIRQEAPRGAVLLLPTVRPAPDHRMRAKVPVFADLSTALASADNEYFQLLHRRSTWSHPTLLTVAARPGLPEAVRRLVGDTNDLTDPHFKAIPPPGSALDPNRDADRQQARDWLLDQGLCCVVLDAAVFEPPWLDRALSFWGPFAETRTFEDGTGVIVGFLAPR